MTDSQAIVERLEKVERRTFAHYSDAPFHGPIRPTPLDSQRISMKPKGFWISVEGCGDGWREWCESEAFNLGGLAQKCEITLAQNANLLWLQTPAEIDEFTKRYQTKEDDDSSFNQIDWRSVAHKYDGILIAPYQWESRLSKISRWYYGWDCASGCIWDVSAIASARALAQGGEP